MVRTRLIAPGIIFLIVSNVRENSGRKWKDLQQDDDGKETVEN